MSTREVCWLWFLLRIAEMTPFQLVCPLKSSQAYYLALLGVFLYGDLNRRHVDEAVEGCGACWPGSASDMTRSAWAALVRCFWAPGTGPLLDGRWRTPSVARSFSRARLLSFHHSAPLTFPSRFFPFPSFFGVRSSRVVSIASTEDASVCSLSSDTGDNRFSARTSGLLLIHRPIFVDLQSRLFSFPTLADAVGGLA